MYFEGISLILEETLIFIRRIIKTVSNITRSSKFIKGVACTVQWYAYLSLLKLAIEKLSSIGMPLLAIAEMLGISDMFGKTTDLKNIIQNSLQAAKESLASSSELDARLKMAPSALNGVHKPPYHSIAIHEVVYEFSNVAGTGSMIIVFNPEGFGMKPKVPQIIKYVDEAEFAEFIASKSWGNYWRINYLLGGRRKRRNVKTREAKGTNLLTGEDYPVPEAEALDDYIERVLALPNGSDEIIAGEFKEQILYALDKQADLTEQFAKAIEKGSLGRGVEENGLRITNVLNEGLRAVPGNLKGIITKNPIIKDVAKLLPSVKSQIGRLRNLRNGLFSASHLNSLSAEAAAAMGSIGGTQAALLEVGAATNFGFKIGKDLTIEATRASLAADAAYTEAMLQANGIANSIIESMYGLGGNINYGSSTYTEFIQNEIGDMIRGEYEYGISIDPKAMADLEEKLNLSKEFDNITQKFADGEATIQEFFEAGKSVGAIEGELGLLATNDIIKHAASGFVKPPTCIPFIK